MVWPSEVAPLWLASVASGKAGAFARRLWVRPLVVQQPCEWLLPEGLVGVVYFA